MLIWKSLTPLKVSLFVLQATHGNILTCDNLLKTRNILVNGCFICRGDFEINGSLVPSFPSC